ncbi:MAG: J domain-containing protein [Abditibacteriales bacterium]|nr:J domain-containing protein [Abditibacteriales bacterium]
MAAKSKDSNEILGVSRNATDKEIKQAYRKLARQYHPDVNPHNKAAEERFKEISEAYAVLGDPEKRKKYDQFGANWEQFERAGVNPEDFGWAPGNVRVEYRTSGDFSDLRDLFGDMGGFGGDLFETLFGGRKGRRGGRATEFAMRGNDVEAELPLTLEEAHHGVTRSLSVGGKTLEVKVPAGVRDGSVIRLAGQGQPGVGGGQAGDLLLRVKLLPHPRFTVAGDDVEMELPIAPWEAVLGAKVTVPTLDGNVEMTIPAGAQGGQRLRLREKGLNRRGGGRGDLYVKLRIVVPKNPTAEERRLFEELAKVSRFRAR